MPRGWRDGFGSALSLVLVVGCAAPTAPPPETPAPQPAEPGPDRRAISTALDAISPGSTSLETSVRFLVASKDKGALEAARIKLAELARFIGSTTSVDSQHQDEELGRIIALMAEVGGMPLLDYCLLLAKSKEPTAAVRRAALRIVEREAPETAGLDEIRQSVDAQAGSEAKASVPNAAVVVLTLKLEFRRCFNLQLQKDPKYMGDKLRLTLEVGAQGEVVSVKTTSTRRADFAQCLEDVARGARFEPPAAGHAFVVIPLNFMRE